MKKALIVDDISDYVDSVASFIEDRFDVLKAFGVKEAQEILSNNQVDLAIFDIRLNEDDPNNKDGLNLLAWVKERHPEIPIIIMSAYREFDLAVDALNAGAKYFMRKPLDPEELNSAIDRIV